MKILLAADGSKYTKKALAFLVTHESLCGPDDELLVLNVQVPVPTRVKRMLGAAAVKAYHADEARKVLGPIERFLRSHPITCRTDWVVGSPPAEILRAGRQAHSQLLVAGTHGHGALGRAVLGSIAQRIVTDSDIPVLLVK